MAFKVGTVTGPLDFFQTLLNFLQNDPALVALNQNWVIAWTDPRGAPEGVVMKGPGLAGQDSIYVGLRLVVDAPAQVSHLELSGCTGVNPAASHWRDHLQVCPSWQRLFLDTASMRYWFVANGRRFITVVNISTIYESAYAGFFLPYATPLSYPYPFFIGGSASQYLNTNTPLNWRSEHDYHRTFMDPVTGGSSSTIVPSNAWMLNPAGEWTPFGRPGFGSAADVYLHPRAQDNEDNIEYGRADNYSLGVDYVATRLIEAYGGDRFLFPATIMQRNPSAQTFGVLEGCFKAQGLDNVVENVVKLGNVDCIVVQNAFRAALREYWALRLE